MSTMWFNRTPGSKVAQGTTDPNSLMLGADVPDWVRLPDELGGARMRVIKALTDSCPKCGNDHKVRHLFLEGTGIAVAECHVHGFLWYAQPEKEDKT